MPTMYSTRIQTSLLCPSNLYFPIPITIIGHLKIRPWCTDKRQVIHCHNSKKYAKMKFNIAAIAIALHSATASTTTNTQLNKLHAIAKIEVIRSASTSKALDADYIDRPAQRPPPGARAKIPVPANDPKVVGGSDATPGEYPFMVMVGSNGLLSCGGSLVSPNTVLCAAHCFSAAQQVYIGRHDISVSNEIGAETFNVIEAVMHPSYSPNTINNDYMMLKLSGNSTYTPIALDDGTLSPNFIGGEDLQLIGWGRTSGGGKLKL